MYKLLLCWRYLRTRYIALVCIVSVMLGVATMIVVNSVMAGFTNEMQARLNGMLGDLVFECRSMDGVADAELHMAKIRQVAGDSVVGMSPTVSVPASALIAPPFFNFSSMVSAVSANAPERGVKLPQNSAYARKMTLKSSGASVGAA